MTERSILVGLTLFLWVGCSPVRRIPAPNTSPAAHSIPIPQAQAHYLRGQLALMDGDLEAASASLSLARVFDPTSATIPMAQGEVYLVGGDLETARERWEEATRLSPTSSAAWIYLARADRLMGKLESSAKHYAEAVRLGHGWRAIAGQIDVLTHAGDSVAAKEVLAEWVSLELSDPLILGERGQRRLRHGDPDGARSDLQALVSDRPRDLAAIERWLDATRASGLYGSTLDALTEMHRIDPSSEPTLWALVVLTDEVGDPYRQAQALEDWLRLEPEGRFNLEVALAGAWTAAGRPADAVELLNQLPDDVRQEPEARWQLAHALLVLDRVGEAAARLGTAPEESAQTNARRWAQLDAAIALARGDDRRARSLTVAGLGPVQAVLAWSAVLQDSGRLTEARAVLDAAMSDLPNDAELAEVAALTALEMSDANHAVSILDPWMARDSAPPVSLRYVYGQALWRTGDVEAARGVMVEVHEQDPRHVGALVRLAEAMATEDIDRAMAMAQEASDRAPTDPAALSSLGWLCHLVGQNSDARTWLERAAVLAPNDLVVQERIRQLDMAETDR